VFGSGLAETTIFHPIPTQMPSSSYCHNLTKQAKRAIIYIQKSVFQTAECEFISKAISILAVVIILALQNRVTLGDSDG
jgi:hypothetical protein